jgi:hypothetical protein
MCCSSSEGIAEELRQLMLPRLRIKEVNRKVVPPEPHVNSLLVVTTNGKEVSAILTKRGVIDTKGV